MKINIKKLDERAVIPTKGSPYSAGFDLYALNSKVVPAGKTVKVGTGVALEIPEGYFGGIFARSGLATKKGLRPANCVGVVDADYRGEIIVALHNDSHSDYLVETGERIAQIVILPFLSCELFETDELSETVRGTGGFGSTGIN